jgi:hypothetical protein
MGRWGRTLVFFLVGFLLSAAVSWSILTSPGFTLPGWLPWLIAAVLVIARLRGRKTARPIAFLLGVGAQYAAFLALLFLGPSIADRLHRQRFEPVAWQRNLDALSMWPARLTMVDDLLASHRLQGLHREEVVRLLGPPETGETSPNGHMVYLLGPERGLIRIDSESLVIRLDEAGRVVAAAIERD